jgi:hypothetical protein
MKLLIINNNNNNNNNNKTRVERRCKPATTELVFHNCAVELPSAK